MTRFQRAAFNLSTVDGREAQGPYYLILKAKHLNSTTFLQLHPKSFWPYALSSFFQTAAYASGQSWLTIHIYRNVERSAYGNGQVDSYFLIFGLIVASILGGLVGDLVLGNKRAIQLGLLLQSLGAVLLSISFPTFLNIAVPVMLLGVGLFVPNFHAHFGKIYLKIQGKIDSGFTFLQLGNMIGIMLATFLIFKLAEMYEWLGFGFIILLSLVGFIFTFFLPDQINFDPALRKKSSMPQILLLIFAFLIMTAYYEFGELQISKNELFTNKATRDYNFLAWRSFGVIFFCSLLGILWTISNIKTSLKFGLGALLGFAALYLLHVSAQDIGDNPLRWLIPVVILWALADSLLTPMLHALITKTTNPKYLAIVSSFIVVASRIVSVAGMLFLWFYFLQT